MIAVTGLSKRYDGRAVVDRVSFDVPKGEVLALLGGSGSGKTTTLKMINRLIEPTEGEVRIGEKDTRDVEPHELRRKIGYVLQEIGLFPHMTIEDNVGITPRLLGWDPKRIDERVTELLSLVELDPKLVRKRRATELSGGQRQRVGIARALAADPEVMLLDEPFGALDPITRRKLWGLFRRVREQRSLTAILVTHDVAEAMALGTKVAVMRDGKLIQIGTGPELEREPADDYVRALLSGEGPEEVTA